MATDDFSGNAGPRCSIFPDQHKYVDGRCVECGDRLQTEAERLREGIELLIAWAEPKADLSIYTESMVRSLKRLLEGKTP